MDIYSAEVHAEKLLTYARNLSETNPQMYSKSKQRIRSLATDCQSVAQLLLDFLKEPVCTVESVSDALPTHDVLRWLQSIQAEIVELKDFVNFTSIDASDDKATHPLENLQDIPSRNKVSSSARKRVVSSYGSVLHQLASRSISISAVSDCAKLLWYWFDARFFQSSHTQFRYNIKRIPVWVHDIVIAYGKSVEAGTANEFITNFQSWCDSLTCAASSNKYAVPYEVYCIDTSARSSDMSLAAVVIWDILLDSGLSALCNNDGSNMYISEDMVYAKCASLNPEVLDRYRSYKQDPTILVECKLQSDSI